MKKVRFTSAGMALAVATAAAGGIVLIDTFHLRPCAEQQKWVALRGRADRAEQAVRMVLHEEQQRLAAAASVEARRPAVGAALSAGRPEGGVSRLPRPIAAEGGVDVAWLTDREGKVLALWRGPFLKDADDGADPPRLAGLVEELAHMSASEGSRAVDHLSRGWIVLACEPIPDPSGDARPLGRLWLGRRLGESILSKIGIAVGGRALLVEAEQLPAGVARSDASPRRLWLDQEGTLVMACPLPDGCGGMSGYLRADLPVPGIRQMAASAQRTSLIVLTLSAGVALLVIMAMHVLIVGPILRLLKRVASLRGGRGAPAELMDDLHGEPRMLAQELVDSFEKLAAVSMADPLTGLGNRGHFEEVLSAFYYQARRYHRPLSLIVIDIDSFKAINDVGGHPLGDEVLRRVGEILKRTCRRADLPARVGADEFCVILPETTAEEAGALAERLRQELAPEVVRANSIEMGLTVSMGITDLNADKLDSSSEMMTLAEKTLQAAKASGRNRVAQACDLNAMIRLGDPGEASRVASLRGRLTGLDDNFRSVLARSLETMTRILAERDPHRADHARRTQYYAKLIAEEMELSMHMVKQIEIAAGLHDLGMAALPDDVLLCEGPLDERQMEIMRRHPLLSVRIMEGMALLEQEIATVRYHHERYDGSGYPDGLAGAAIPLTSRILTVADVFAAMTAPRNHRRAKSCAEALEEIRRGAGTQFDPSVAEAFLALADRLGENMMDPERSQAPRLSDTAAMSTPGGG